MESINNLELNSKNSLRKFPFTDASTGTFDGGFIPDDLILDARIYCRNSYKANNTCYISKIECTYRGVIITISYAKSTVGTATILFNTSEEQIPIYDGDVIAGCLVIDPAKVYILEAFGLTSFDLPDTVLQFVPSVVEFIPQTAVTSLNSLSNSIALFADVGTKFTISDTNSIKIDIVGDPHFNRYGCNDAQRLIYNQTVNTTIKQLRLKFWTRNSENNLVQVELNVLPNDDNSFTVPMFASDKSVVEADPTSRPALRLTVEDNVLTFSLSGA